MQIRKRPTRRTTGGWEKEGQGYKPDFRPKERSALELGLNAIPPWGPAIPRGRRLDSPPITGVFPRGSAAYLRVYRGQHENAELMAISSPSLDRLEVLLFPGYTQIVIRYDPGKGLVAQRIRPAH